MAKVNLLFLLFKVVWFIYQKATFLNFMVIHMRKLGNEGTSLENNEE